MVLAPIHLTELCMGLKRFIETLIARAHIKSPPVSLFRSSTGQRKNGRRRDLHSISNPLYSAFGLGVALRAFAEIYLACLRFPDLLHLKKQCSECPEGAAKKPEVIRSALYSQCLVGSFNLGDSTASIQPGKPACYYPLIIPHNPSTFQTVRKNCLAIPP